MEKIIETISDSENSNENLNKSALSFIRTYDRKHGTEWSDNTMGIARVFCEYDKTINPKSKRTLDDAYTFIKSYDNVSGETWANDTDEVTIVMATYANNK